MNKTENKGKWILWGIAALLALFAVSWVVQGNDWFMYKFWAPKYEQVRRETYEQTKSYRQGSIQRLDNLCLQVAGADENHVSMINDVIRGEFVEWNSEDVPVHLRSCLSNARAS